jgi:hypothetical protein
MMSGAVAEIVQGRRSEYPPTMHWTSLVAAMGLQLDEHALDPWVVLISSLAVLVVLWGAAVVALLRHRSG